MLKKIILGMLLIGSAAMAVKSPDWENMECFGLEDDIVQYVENLTKMKKASDENAMLEGGKEVEVVEYSKKCQIKITHIIKEHGNVLSKEDVDGLYENMMMLIAIEDLLGDGTTSRLK